MTFKSGDRCSADHHTTFAFVVRVVELHYGCGFFSHYISADQVDLDYTDEILSRPRTITTQRATGGCDARAIDGQGNATHEFIGRLNGGFYSTFIRHICAHKFCSLTQFGDTRRALFCIDVEQHGLAAGGNDALCGSEPKSGGTAGDDCFGSIDIHNYSLLINFNSDRDSFAATDAQ